MTRLNTWFAVGIAAVAFVGGLAVAQDDLNLKNRQELEREALTGTNMEVIISVIEAQPGELLVRHIHHGEEAFHVLQGAPLETPDGKQIPLATGAAAAAALLALLGNICCANYRSAVTGCVYYSATQARSQYRARAR